MIHSSNYKPRCYPYGSGGPAEIDRVQNLTTALTLNREKIKEVGTEGTIDWKKRIPSLRMTITQYEYGMIEFWRKLANQATSNSIVLNDFKTSMIDVCGYKTDDNGTFLGTVWYPKLRLAGFSINIGDPQAYVERSIELVGEDETLFLNNNKYFIMREFTANAGSNQTFTVSDGGTTYPNPVLDPDNSGVFLARVDRIRTGTPSTLTLTTDYSFNSSTQVLTVVTTNAGDLIRAYWTAGSYITGENPFTTNTTDASALSADFCSIYLESANYLYKLQSVGINVSFDRTDYYEIGADTIIQRGIRNKTCSITLGRIIDAYTVEEVARGVAGSSYGKIDSRKYADNLQLFVRLYSSAAKSTFLLKYHFTDLSPVSADTGTPVDDYISRGIVLEGEACTIATIL